MKINIKPLLFLLCLSFIISCSDDGYADYDPGQTKVRELSGEWYIIGYGPDGEPALNGDYSLWSTYNTAENNTKMWLDGHESAFEVKTIVEANVKNLSFSGEEGSSEVLNGGTLTVTEGKVIKNGGRANSGTVTDSITFKIEFDWAPGIIYTFGGHERTGFLEDEDPSYYD